jgi:hypothetical protein
MRSINWCLAIVFVCTSFVGAVEIEVFSLLSLNVRISTECIDAVVDTQSDSVAIRISAKKETVGRLSFEGESLVAVYEEASKDKDETEAFFGPANEFLLVEVESKKSFKVAIEASGKRFQIAPMVKLGDGQYVPAKFSYISDSASLLRLLQGLN